MNHLLLTLSFIALPYTQLIAQNLEELGLKKGVKINGSVNINTIGYIARGIEQRRDPLNWFAAGNLNVNLFGYNAPFSFSYSNVNKSYSQPFNQFSFTPQYKWVKAYVGYNAMTFSSYTLAGHVFLGGGMELTPGKWRIAAMYGRLKKAVLFNPEDTLQNSNAAYKRMGYGVKIGYESNGDAITANIFTAKDDVHSLPYVLPGSQLTPKQNVAMSLSVRKKFLKRFFVESEYAISVLNNNTKANGEGDTIAITPTHNLVKGLLPENAISRYYDAVRASAGYQGNWFVIQLRYERIAPEYQTLGAYYFNNDMRNITIAPAFRLLQNRLNLGFNAGVQENNLDKSRASVTKRVAGALNATYAPSDQWNFGVNYSNFSSYTNLRPRQDPFYQNTMDTLNFYQVSQTMSGTVMRNLGDKEKPRSVTLSGSYQKANDRPSHDHGQQSDFVTLNVAYNHSIVASNTILSVAANAFANRVAGMRSNYFGPTLSITKAMLEKTLRGSWACAYNQTSGNTDISPILNNRISLNYSPVAEKLDSKSAHSFSLGINILNRLKSVEQQPVYAELTCTINYSYSF
ncbi:hypothetical protein [Chryseolinea soli]|uniref:Uncharacterized protein n=1 Tax=Chryseolinea soli TaxID=2321403 RepID=A0A385SDX6_9BACT|nr:hypothetical protein [Chryseolinea soli]AYB29174.1 hypothetical protein D4L85_00605 [Chryseolinea soli]